MAQDSAHTNPASRRTPPAATESAHFRTVLGRFPTGVTVVTAQDGAKPVGMAIGSFTSVSLDPPLVAFLPAKSSSSWPAIERAGVFCVNIIAEDQGAICAAFASRAEDKFAGVAWERAGTGSPRLAGCIAWMDCTIEAVHEGGDHWIVVGRVQEMDVDLERDVGPLLFFKGAYGTFAD